MTKNLDELLCQKYPEIFKDRHAPMNQTLMCWGFQCGDGWFAIIDTLCNSLMSSTRHAQQNYQSRLDTRARIDDGTLTPEEKSFTFLNDYASDAALAEAKSQIDHEKSQIPVAVQVKEKFGGLRFYVTGGTDAHDIMIQFAEDMSYRVCEDCGTTKDAKLRRGGWHRTLCSSCALADGRSFENEPSDDELWGV